MADSILLAGSFIFGFLFIFLMFVLFTSAASLIKKEKTYICQPKLSVLIPCYNEEKNILRCLKAVYFSDYPKEKFEVIVVDDGSTDSTLKILRNARKQFPLLTIIKGDHQGKSASLNKASKKAKYDIIFAVDADTILAKDTMKKMVQPFADKEVGATNGSCVPRNKNSILGMFQNIEYHYNNLIRKGFSCLFGTGIWFFGAFACYRKDVLEKVGYFKKDTLTEDMDIALEIYAAGYKTINIHDAFGYVLVPASIKGFIEQRTRWWIGVLQALKKNKTLFSPRSSPSILFLFINQYWWSFYAIASMFLIGYQYNYWLSYNISNFYTLFMYTFRWFSLLGPVHVIYMIPEWGISIYSIFGVLSGLITAVLLIKSLLIFRQEFSFRNLFSIFFYFPYTIILNTIVVISIFKIIFLKQRYFIY